MIEQSDVDYRQHLELAVETAGAVGAGDDQARAAAPSAAAATDSTEEWLRPYTPPEPSTWNPHKQHWLSAAARTAEQGGYTQKLRKRRSRIRRQPTEPESRRAWSVEPALAWESRPSRASPITPPVVLAPKSSAHKGRGYPPTSSPAHGPDELMDIRPLPNDTTLSAAFCPEMGIRGGDPRRADHPA